MSVGARTAVTASSIAPGPTGRTALVAPEIASSPSDPSAAMPYGEMTAAIAAASVADRAYADAVIASAASMTGPAVPFAFSLYSNTFDGRACTGYYYRQAGSVVVCFDVDVENELYSSAPNTGSLRFVAAAGALPAADLTHPAAVSSAIVWGTEFMSDSYGYFAAMMAVWARDPLELRAVNVYYTSTEGAICGVSANSFTPATAPARHSMRARVLVTYAAQAQR